MRYFNVTQQPLALRSPDKTNSTRPLPFLPDTNDKSTTSAQSRAAKVIKDGSSRLVSGLPVIKSSMSSSSSRPRKGWCDGARNSVLFKSPFVDCTAIELEIQRSYEKYHDGCGRLCCGTLVDDNCKKASNWLQLLPDFGHKCCHQVAAEFRDHAPIIVATTRPVMCQVDVSAFRDEGRLKRVMRRCLGGNTVDCQRNSVMKECSVSKVTFYTNNSRLSISMQFRIDESTKKDRVVDV
ncbi:hypothetical protein BV898_18101 [Hypsibius exemplaris]|uniref:Uncharacterized protein n=1 Tax=Hypsibius exemplaris TaxID=2072580 RepID=A0A9X6NGX7_HYPEX|nr:hypothetical protein BV898_18101 [Hypsibius exemplaris]